MSNHEGSGAKSIVIMKTTFDGSFFLPLTSVDRLPNHSTYIVTSVVIRNPNCLVQQSTQANKGTAPGTR